MAEKRERDLADAVADAKREVSEHAKKERRRTAREYGVFLRHLRELERSLASTAEELGRISKALPEPPGALAEAFHPEPAEAAEAAPRRLDRKRRHPETFPDGTVLIAKRLASEGHSRADVFAFLEENFDDIDARATVDELFEGAGQAQAAEA